MPRESPGRPAPWQHPVSAFVLGLSGFLAGVGLLLLGSSRTDRSRDFVQSVGFAIWAATIGAQTAFWVIVAAPLWADLASIWQRAKLGRLAAATLATVLVVILVVFPQFSAASEIQWPLWGQHLKTSVLTITGGLLVAVPALSGIALVQHRIRYRETEPIDDDDVRAAIEARTDMLRFLFLGGAAIGLAVLGSGTLHRATVPVFVDPDAFPQEAILLYGAFFTGLLVLVYVPAHLTLKRFGLKVRDHYFPLSEMPEPGADAFKSWLDKRAALEELLQLHVSPAQQLQTSLFIIAPLLSAVISSVVPRLA